MNSCEIEIFGDIQKTEYMYSIELYSNNQCTNFQVNIFIFGCVMAEKLGEGDDFTF